MKSKILIEQDLSKNLFSMEVTGKQEDLILGLIKTLADHDLQGTLFSMFVTAMYEASYKRNFDMVNSYQVFLKDRIILQNSQDKERGGGHE